MTFQDYEQIFRGLLLNFSLILLPIFIYESLVLDKAVYITRRISNLEITLITSLTVILSMTFPVSLFDGHIFDLRLIPVLISLLYGSIGSAFITIFIMFVYRLYISGDGIFTMLVVYSFVVTLGFYIAPRFKLLPSKRKMLIILNITLVAMGLMFFSAYLLNLTKDQFSRVFLINFFISFTFIKVLAVYLTFHLIEGIIEKRELRIELQRADRLNTVGELAASLAHEIRNPLTVSKGYMQLIKINGKLEENKLMEYVNTSLQEIDRAENVISDFLAFAKPNVDNMDNVNVNDLILSVCKFMSSYATLNNVVILQELDDQCFLYTDKNKLTQILVNIIKNSIEAMDKGGNIEVRTFKEEDLVVIEVEDYGIGMTKEEVSRIGTPFYTLKNSGTGLGLMVSYKFIQLLDGKVKVDSEKGKGTKFSISFPSTKSKKEMA